MVDYGFVRFMTSGYITQEELSWLQTFTVRATRPYGLGKLFKLKRFNLIFHVII